LPGTGLKHPTHGHLVFDIETTALPLEQFDDYQQEYLFRIAERLHDEAARALRREEILRQFNLWPLTAQVICIAMLNADTSRGQVHFTCPEYRIRKTRLGRSSSLAAWTKSSLLTAFWDVAAIMNTSSLSTAVVFDVPFIYLRSALLNVPISRKDWLGYRFQSEPHCDLAEQLSFYNVSGREGAARRFNLDFYCKAFGIDSPKMHGVTGADMNEMIAAGNCGKLPITACGMLRLRCCSIRSGKIAWQVSSRPRGTPRTQHHEFRSCLFCGPSEATPFKRLLKASHLDDVQVLVHRDGPRECLTRCGCRACISHAKLGAHLRLRRRPEP
jgi:hypothetical protein